MIIWRFFIIGIIFLLNIGCSKKEEVSISDLITLKGITYLKFLDQTEFNNKELFTGIGIDRYNYNQKKIRTYYKNGKKHGESLSWYPSGQLKEKGKYKKGKKIGKHKGFWPNGILRFEKIYLEGLLHGEQNQYHQNGIVSRLSNYKSGKENGLQKGWRVNGDLKYNYQIIKNKRYGFMGSKVCVPVSF